MTVISEAEAVKNSRSAVDGHAARVGQIVAQDLDGRSHLAGGSLRLYE
jgi:hypothetical protein